MTGPPIPPRGQGAAGSPPAAKAPDAQALVMRLSVPSDGSLNVVAADVTAKVAEFLGAEASSIGKTLDGLMSRVARSGEDVTLEFRHIDRELVIQARCNGRSSEVRHPLPA